MAEQVQKHRMLINRFLDAQNSNLTELIIEHPFTQRRLNDVGAIQAISRPKNGISSSPRKQGRLAIEIANSPIHAVCAND